MIGVVGGCRNWLFIPPCMDAARSRGNSPDNQRAWRNGGHGIKLDEFLGCRSSSIIEELCRCVHYVAPLIQVQGDT